MKCQFNEKGQIEIVAETNSDLQALSVFTKDPSAYIVIKGHMGLTFPTGPSVAELIYKKKDGSQ